MKTSPRKSGGFPEAEKGPRRRGRGRWPGSLAAKPSPAEAILSLSGCPRLRRCAAAAGRLSSLYPLALNERSSGAEIEGPGSAPGWREANCWLSNLPFPGGGGGKQGVPEELLVLGFQAAVEAEELGFSASGGGCLSRGQQARVDQALCTRPKNLCGRPLPWDTQLSLLAAHSA